MAALSMLFVWAWTAKRNIIYKTEVLVTESRFVNDAGTDGVFIFDLSEEDGKLDIIVVYKVDRLTRRLADFAKIVEILDSHRVSFVFVTQQFNTTSSMGRLTLKVCSRSLSLRGS